MSECCHVFGVQMLLAVERDPKNPGMYFHSILTDLSCNSIHSFPFFFILNFIVFFCLLYDDVVIFSFPSLQPHTEVGYKKKKERKRVKAQHITYTKGGRIRKESYKTNVKKARREWSDKNEKREKQRSRKVT